MNAGAEDFIVKPLQSKDVQRLRNCSPANTQCCDAGSDGKPPLLLLPSDHVVVDATAASPPPPPSRRRAHFAGVAMASPPLMHCICYTQPPALSSPVAIGEFYKKENHRLNLLAAAFSLSGRALVERRAVTLLPFPLQVHPAGVRHPVPG